MSIKILVDMNLSPDWALLLQREGWRALHWSAVGDTHAADQILMEWALINEFVVFTQDLDFGTMLALTHATGPSVLLLRSDDAFLNHAGPLIVAVLHQNEEVLAAGALIVVDEKKQRLRVLPL